MIIILCQIYDDETYWSMKANKKQHYYRKYDGRRNV
jgi:hypothetical protein